MPNLTINKELEKLSNDIFEFNKVFADYSGVTFNTHAYNIVKKGIEELKKKAQSLPQTAAKSDFEKFVLRHIKSCLEVQEIYADYFSNPQTKHTIKEMIDKMLGDGTYDYAEKTVKDLPFRDQWEKIHSIKHLRLNIVRNDTPEARSLIEGMIPDFKKEMLTLGKQLGFIPQEYDFEFVLLPPFGNARSNFRIEVNRLELNPFSFVCLKEGNRYRIQPARAYLETAHELLGHGGHNQFSLQMPKCLQLGGMNIANLASKPIAEGLALDRENWGVEYLKKIKEKIKLDDEELKSVLIDNDIRVSESTWYPYYTVLKERELVEEGFNAKEYMREKGFPFYFYRDTRWLPQMHITQAVIELAYISGLKHLKNTRKRIKEELGEQFVTQNEALINKALATGNWAWDVYSDFVLWYLKEINRGK